MRDDPSFLQYADDTILFVEHDLEKVKKSEINFVIIRATFGSPNKFS
jgi:hypothetical protein